MRTGFFNSAFWKRIVGIALAISIFTIAHAKQNSLYRSPTSSTTPTPLPTASPPPSESLLSAFGDKSGRQQDTSLILEQQNRELENGGRGSLSTQDNLSSGKSRAAEMVQILQTEDMKNALQKVTLKGKEALNSPSMRTPIGVIAGAAALWMGNTVKLIRGDEFKLTTRIEGRNRTSEFSMESPLLNGKFRFSAADGIDIFMNRRISSINAQAELNYSLRNQSFSTQIRRRIAPNLDFSFGAAQIPQTTTTDGNARIEYRLNF